MKSFAIKYFDGSTSQQHQGELILKPDLWEINLMEDGVTYKNINWRISNIRQSEFVGGSNLFKYGDFPQQTIECNDSNLHQALKSQYPYHHFFNPTNSWALSAGFGIIISLAVGILFIIFGLYKWALPPIAEAFAEKIPIEYEVKWGDTMLKNIVDSENKIGDMSYSKNDSLSELANQFVSKIDFQSPYQLKITVVKSDQINAFALPGGNVVVFDALLKKLKTKEEFAALLGHEIAHINQKHSLKNLFRNLSGYLFISLITSDLNGMSVVLFENANSILNLEYSRELEAEADSFAVKTLQKNELNTIGLLNLFNILEKATTIEPYEILSSHPLTQDRKVFAKKHLIQTKSYPKKEELEKIWQEISKKR
ncbi:MAG: M48 family metallopeptidase [Bacteroidota bacterium]